MGQWSQMYCVIGVFIVFPSSNFGESPVGRSYHWFQAIVSDRTLESSKKRGDLGYWRIPITALHSPFCFQDNAEDFLWNFHK